MKCREAWACTEESLPLSENPIRFAVWRRNGLSSNSWRVWVEKHGDVYVVCRDHLGGMKISLHQSGKCHMVSDHKVHFDGDRYMGRWESPLTDDSKFVVPLQLMFPTSALCVNQEHRDRNSGIWAKNRTYIGAPEAPFGTRVSFVIADDTIKKIDVEKSLSYPLAVMSAWAGTRLWVVVSHEYEENMLRVAADIIRNFGDIIDKDTAERLALEPDGKVLTITVSGPTADGSVYLMPFPVEIGTI